MAKLAIKSDNRKQNLLLPPSLDELVPECRVYGAESTVGPGYYLLTTFFVSLRHIFVSVMNAVSVTLFPGYGPLAPICLWMR